MYAKGSRSPHRLRTLKRKLAYSTLTSLRFRGASGVEFQSLKGHGTVVAYSCMLDVNVRLSLRPLCTNSFPEIDKEERYEKFLCEEIGLRGRSSFYAVPVFSSSVSAE